jgi:hypothetical protein
MTYHPSPITYGFPWQLMLGYWLSALEHIRPIRPIRPICPFRPATPGSLKAGEEAPAQSPIGAKKKQWRPIREGKHIKSRE